MSGRNITSIILTGILLGFSVQAWAYSGDTIQDDIVREFQGVPSYTIPLAAPPQPVPTTPPTCAATLQQEMEDGQISTDEQCYCPVGATQPVCTALPGSDCPNLLQIEENRLGSDAQYEDCTCPTGASTPQCTSYYQLCEAALPNYQNGTNECSCSQTAVSAVPTCVQKPPPPAPPKVFFNDSNQFVTGYGVYWTENSDSQTVTITTPAGCQSQGKITTVASGIYVLSGVVPGGTSCSLNPPTCVTQVINNNNDTIATYNSNNGNTITTSYNLNDGTAEAIGNFFNSSTNETGFDKNSNYGGKTFTDVFSNETQSSIADNVGASVSLSYPSTCG